MGKRILASFLCFAMVLSMEVISVLAETGNPLNTQSGLNDAGDEDYADDEDNENFPITGTFGDSVTWSLDENYEMTISGNGAIEEHDDLWYNYYSKIVSVIIEDGVTSIGRQAFIDCESLISVSIPSSVTSIGDSAFAYCYNLKEIDIPESVVSIGNDAFYDCTGLASVNIPEGVTNIGEGAFNGCTGLTEIMIPSTVIEIGRVAFCGDSSLTSIMVEADNSVYSSVDGVLFNKEMTILIQYPANKSDQIYEIPSGVTKLEEYSFYGCENILNVNIPSSVCEIGYVSFSGCKNLTELIIPEGITIIEDGLCSDCTSLETVSLPSSVTVIGWYAFSECVSLKNIVIPEGVSSIGWMAFSECTSLENVNIPSSVIDIGMQAFFNCTSLQSITIPSSVITVGSRAVGYCYDSDHNRIILDGFVIYGESGSEAENYANENNITFSVIDSTATNVSTCTVTFSNDSYTYDGTAKKPTVTVKNSSGKTLTSGTDYTVKYSNNTNAGTANITITGRGDYTGTITKTFTISKASQTVTASAASSSIKAGKTTTITASGTGTITYSSSDTSIATVSSSGKVTGKGVGTVTITVKVAGNSNYKSATKKVTIKVGLSTPSIKSVAQSNKSVTVTWSKITGAKGYYVYRSTSKNGTYTKIKEISSGSTVSYTDTATKTSGKTYYYKVYAYSGSTKSSASLVKSLKYMKGTVASLTNTSSGITVTWSKVSGATGYYVYRKASTASSYTKVTTIKSGSTVTYTDTGIKSKNGTTYTYYVQPYNSTSKGAYATKKTVRMTAVSISSLNNSSSKKMTVKWATNSKATGYQIQYSMSSSFASGNKIVTVSKASTTSNTIKNLMKNKTYYVRVRTYKTVGGTKYYSEWSKKKSVKISK